MTHTTGAQNDAPGAEVYIERRQQVSAAPARCPTLDPAHQDDVDRMNLWSAYRWMNNGGAPAPPITRTSYYASGDIPNRYAPGAYSGVAGSYYAPGPRNILAGGAAAARW